MGQVIFHRLMYETLSIKPKIQKPFKEKEMVQECPGKVFENSENCRVSKARTMRIGLELACSGGSCGEILLKKRDGCHLKKLPALSSVSS